MPVCDLDGARPRPLHGHIWTGEKENVQTTRMAPPLAPASWLIGETAFSLPCSALALLSLDTISCTENIQPLSDSIQFKAFNWGKLYSPALNACEFVCVCVCVLVQLFVTPWTVACQTPLSMGFSRQEYWSGLPFPSPGHLPNPGIKLGFPALQADSLLSV